MRKISLSIFIILSIIIFAGCSSAWENAIVNEDIEKIKELINQGQNVDEVLAFENGTTKKTALIYSENLEICKLLIKNGADVNYVLKESMNETPIFRTYDVEKMKLLIANGANVNQENEFRSTPLILHQNPNIIQLLIDSGADMHVEDELGQTPLVDGYISKEKAEVLINNGVNINKKNDLRKNALSEVYSAYEYNFEKGDTKTAKERLEVIKLLVDNGVPLISQTGSGTPLTQAKKLPNADKELINVLSKANPSILAYNSNGLFTKKGLTIQKGWTFTTEGDYYYVKGSVKNTGDISADYFEVVAEFKDSNGNVIDTDYTNSGQTIKPSNSKKFEIMYPYDSNIESVTIYVDDIRWNY